MLIRIKYCCEEHSDLAFDDFLVENETFPNMEEALGEKCHYCSKAARYELKLPQELNFLETKDDM